MLGMLLGLAASPLLAVLQLCSKPASQPGVLQARLHPSMTTQHCTGQHRSSSSLPLTPRRQQVPHGVYELRLEDLPLLVALFEVGVWELDVEGLYAARVVGQHGGQADGGVGEHVVHAAGAAQHLGPLVAALHELRRGLKGVRGVGGGGVGGGVQHVGCVRQLDACCCC